MLTKKPQKTPKKYVCAKCDFITANIKDYNKHLQTIKHNANLCSNMLTQKTPKCICGKSYNHKSSLTRHKKRCIQYINDTIITNVESNIKPQNIGCTEKLESLLLEIISQNQQFMLQNQKMLEKAINEPKTNIINNTFSIQNYLNIECKDAMNLSEYIKQIKYSFDDLQYLHDYGIVKSFENTFVKGLLNMEQNKRPIHCTDAKRCRFFIKNNDVWLRDNENTCIIDSLKKITNEQCDTLQQWKNINKDWLDNEKKQEFANVVTKKIVDIYGSINQNRIITLIKTLCVDEKQLLK